MKLLLDKHLNILQIKHAYQDDKVTGRNAVQQSFDRAHILLDSNSRICSCIDR